MAKDSEHVNYLLRNIEKTLWKQVKARAALEGREIREVIIESLKTYVKKDDLFESWREPRKKSKKEGIN